MAGLATTFSTELDLEGDLEYRLEVDFALVRPPALVPALLPPEEFDSNNFLVSFTMSGAGNSLSFTPNKTPLEDLCF